LVAGLGLAGILGYAVAANIVVRRDLHQEQRTLDATRDDLAFTRRATQVAETQTSDADAQVAARGEERDQAQGEATVAQGELQVAQGTLTGVELTRIAQTTRIGAFPTCLTGVGQTLGLIGAGDRAGASATLSAASASCNTAIGATGGTAPVFAFDFPDPFVLLAGNTYYAYSTNAGAGDIQVAQSPDLRQWSFVGNALAGLPAWAGANRTWAPAVLARPTPLGAAYVVYYTVRTGRNGPQCITRATSGSPIGPFVDDSSGPLICPRHGDAIDPSPFVAADGAPFLFWRGEGGKIWSQRLRGDGLAFEGPAQALIGVDQDWEGKVVEGPSMIGHDGRYYLFYSGNEWNSRSYAIGYAVCASPLGPCTKPVNGALFGSFASVIGPGGQELFADAGGGLWMAYHAFTEPNVGYPNSRRLHLAPVDLTTGAPVVRPGG
jgi:beta-xylosidase